MGGEFMLFKPPTPRLSQLLLVVPAEFDYERACVAVQRFPLVSHRPAMSASPGWNVDLFLHRNSSQISRVVLT